MPAPAHALTAAAVGAALLAGCGGGSTGHGGRTAAVPAPPAASAAVVANRAPFTWLRSRATSSGWTRLAIRSGDATFSYPSGWRKLHADPGAATVALVGPPVVSGHPFVRAFLNATPQQGAERPRGWAHFRSAHNSDEGDHNVRILAAAERLRFPAGGRGSCVVDQYRSKVDSNPYREIACIVAGARSTTVLIAAAQPHDWAALGPALERATSSFVER